jgi:serine protease inhibitor
MPRSLGRSLGWFSLILIPCALFAWVAWSALSANPESAGKAPAEDVKSVADANNRFALDLYGKLKKGDGNLFYSPYSISTALAMTYAGARAKTAEEMAKTLHFDLPPDRLHPGCGRLIESVNEAGKRGEVQLAVANRLWGQKQEPFLKDFLDLTERWYRARCIDLDFGDADEALKTINGWVEKQTVDKIKDLVKPSDFNPIPVLILTNAIYMKADWLSKFDKQATKEESFFAPGNRESTVPTMHQTAKFGYWAEEGGPQVLEMPYAGDRLAMVIFLPRAREGLAELEKRLTFENVGKWLAGLKPEKVRVALPRFAAAQRCDLAEVLQSLGMTDAFRKGAADFSGMNGRKGDLFISKVIHEAFVDVNEEGTEAAAATAVIVTRNGHPTPEFRADHPFVFLIRDRQTGAILFMGRVTDPKSE